MKGAAEAIVPLTTADSELRLRALTKAEELERRGLRVLALARRRLDDGIEATSASVERDLELLGLVGMLDPPRPEVPEAVARCRRAGIRVIMVTGDSGRTALAVARRIGLVDGGRVIDGHELDALGEQELRGARVEKDVVFARIRPEQKLRLARVLRAGGEIAELRPLDEIGVGADPVARVENEQIAGDELLRSDVDLDGVAPHPGALREHADERVGRALRAVLLHEREQRVDEDDHDDCDRELGHPGEPREQRTRPQQEREQVQEVGREPTDVRRTCGLGDPVTPDLPKPPLRLVGRQRPKGSSENGRDSANIAHR